MTQPIWAPLTAFTAALLIIWWLLRSRLSIIALDYPGGRSLHERPMPRTGGIGIHAGVILAWAITAPNLPDAAWAAFAVMLAVSFIEDVGGLSAGWRLGVHLLATGLFAADLLLEAHGWIAAAAAALAIAWMANLYNFMDGSDGLAGGMALIGFGGYGVAAWLSGSTAFALLNFSVAAAAAAFLVFNFHPARTFMGDVGSVPLGFLAAALGIVGWLQRDWTWWFPVLVFSPFIVDASATLARRLLKREKVWEAHRDHYYQRLVLMGWGHRNTALAEYGLMLACAGAGLLAMTQNDAAQIAVLSGIALAYLAMIAALERAWSRFKVVAREHGAADKRR
ncbi:MAG: glycosyltransferase family 4 protein [Betaproteobacteria bacterium]|nr:glycosyltransferase family 4 protein [Betaproteobacteria bacterium]